MANRLKELRTKKPLSQYQLAKRSGVAQSTISDIENGNQSPTERVLRKLATALGVSVADLLEDTQAAGLDKTGTEGR